MQNNNYTQEMFADYPDVVDVSGLQSMLGNIGKQTAYELVRKGTIKAIKVGKLYRTKEYFTKNPVMLVDLKPVHILNFYNWLYSQGLKGTTVTKYHANIRKALDYAVQTDLISNNPAIKVGRPQQEQFIADYYNEEELNNLFKVVKDTTLELIVYLTAFYGLRRSEVLGIRWSAIDMVCNRF